MFVFPSPAYSKGIDMPQMQISSLKKVLQLDLVVYLICLSANACSIRTTSEKVVPYIPPYIVIFGKSRFKLDFF